VALPAAFLTASTCSRAERSGGSAVPALRSAVPASDATVPSVAAHVLTDRASMSRVAVRGSANHCERADSNATLSVLLIQLLFLQPDAAARTSGSSTSLPEHPGRPEQFHPSMKPSGPAARLSASTDGQREAAMAYGRVALGKSGIYPWDFALGL
jgi:hypothetical protein